MVKISPTRWGVGSEVRNTPRIYYSSPFKAWVVSAVVGSETLKDADFGKAAHFIAKLNIGY